MADENPTPPEGTPAVGPAPKPDAGTQPASFRKQLLHGRIDRDFTYHPPQPGQRPIYVEIRRKARELGHYLVDAMPECRELHRALSALEDATFHANAGVARHPDFYAGRAPEEDDGDQEEPDQEPTEG